MENIEFRAVFTSPFGEGSHGPPRASFDEAVKDKPERSEETFEYLSGVESRKIEPWTAMPLSSILEKLRENAE